MLSTSHIPSSHIVKPIPFKAHRLKGLSDKLLESHYENNYGGAVRRLNAIEQRIAKLDWQSVDSFDINGIEREKLIAANSVILHEIYFDSIGEDGGEELNPELASELEKYFGSAERWQLEFTSMAKALASESGWVMLVWSERFQRLTNEWANEHTHNLAGGEPILALDMYEHAYYLDYGSRAEDYVDAFIANIHWGRVNQRFQQARGCKSDLLEHQPQQQHQVSVSELRSMKGEKEPLVLDVRHVEDRQRSGVRVMETPWRDSFSISEWAPKLPKDREIVVYCMYGFWVSEDAATELREQGYNARFLQGGIAAWRAMGYPSTPLDS